MPTIASSQLPPPKSWDEFEDICADLFGLEWQDRNTVRYGRGGQRQCAVDIHGRPAGGGNVGVQCKGKRVWPPTKLTTAEIDRQVAEALIFEPRLTEYLIVTTASDDVRMQDHARVLTETHAKKGLFSVHVFGWEELSRRIKSHDSLIEKHYGFTSLSTVRKDLATLPARILESLQQIEISAQESPADAIEAILSVGQSPARDTPAVGGRRTNTTPPVSKPFVGVPPRIAGFTGRQDELDRLQAVLLQESRVEGTAAIGRAVLHGMPGIGKSSLAIEYVHLFRHAYAGICWCPAETRIGLLTELALLAVTLGVAAAENANLEDTAKAAIRRLAQQQSNWLLIYDNATNPQAIADLLPSVGAQLLITSRFSDWYGWAEEVPLDVLPFQDAAAFLQARAHHTDDSGARTLAEVLGRLPLALDHAAATCRRTQMQFADYAAKASSLIVAAPLGVNYPRSIMATFDLAIGEASAQVPAAETLMAFLAQCAPDRIALTLVDGAIEDETERLAALAVLAELSLLKHDPFEDGTPAVTVHRLVQAVGAARSEIKGLAISAVERMVARLSALYPEDSFNNPQSWPLCIQLNSHLMKWLSVGPTGRDAIHWPGLLTRAGNYLFGRGAYEEAEPFLRDALAIVERSMLGPEHPLTATALCNLAALLHARGNFKEALPLLRRSVAIGEKVFGPDHIETATALNNLAELLREKGDLVEARHLLERALSIQEKSGHEGFGLAQVLNNLALVLEAQGVAGARPLLVRSLSIREKVFGTDHPATAICVNNLALAVQAEGNFSEAQELFERAVAIDEKVLGSDHPRMGQFLSNLASLFHHRGEFAKAMPLFRRALLILDTSIGRDHPASNHVRSKLARLLWDSGFPRQAYTVGNAALVAHAKALGKKHDWTIASARITATALETLGRAKEARALRKRYGIRKIK